jgi:hypothetical protein
VTGNGTTQEPQRYQYRLNDLDYGRHEVRLRQVDIDGTVAYSEARSVEVDLSAAVDAGKPYPNPARSTVSLEIAVREPQIVRVELYDLLGRRVGVLHNDRLPAQRTETLTLNVDRLASGQYFLRITGEAFAETRRISVVR